MKFWRFIFFKNRYYKTTQAKLLKNAKIILLKFFHYLFKSDVIYESLKLFLEGFITVTAPDFIGLATTNMLKNLLNNIGKNFFAQNVMFCSTALSDVVSFKQTVQMKGKYFSEIIF